MQPADKYLVPEAIVPDNIPLAQLIATAIVGRPELAERQAAIRRSLLELNAAKMLPFSPNVILAFSAGTYGGGSNLVTPTFGDFGGRTDLDAVGYWTLQNLAVGNHALIKGAAARRNTSNLQQVAVLNQVRNEVAAAHARVQALCPDRHYRGGGSGRARRLCPGPGRTFAAKRACRSRC